MAYRPTKAPADMAEMLDLVALALPYVEEAAADPANKPAPVLALARRMRQAILNIEATTTT